MLCQPLGIGYKSPNVMQPVDEAPRHFQEGLRLVSAGQMAEAIVQFETAVQIVPDRPEYHYNLGLAYQQARRQVDAIVAYGKALELAPDFFGAWFNMSQASRAAGQLELALSAARTAVSLLPHNPDAHLNLGETLKAMGNAAGADEAHSQAVRAHVHLVASYYQQRELAKAFEHAQAALRLAPKNPQACNSMGVVLLAKNCAEEAIPYFRRALEIDPDLPASWTYLGHAHLYRNRLNEAVSCYHRALATRPSSSEAAYFRAWAELAAGRFETGWPEFERRWNAGGPRYPNRPLWDGQPLHNETVLIYAEHGYGDTLFFSRYAPLVAQRGGRIIMECQPALRGILQTLDGVEAVIAQGETPPPFDLQISVMSLPRIFQTTLHTIPRSVPYLRPPARGTAFQSILSSARLKIGLVWAGSSMLILEQDRSMPLSKLSPLWMLSDTAFYSLQVGPQCAQLGEAKGAERIVNLGPHLNDFAATAAAIQDLDLVISVDTSVAHLAGALGKPVWVLLVYCPDWRWMLDRDDSLWYPTMRLFRQRKPGEDWAEVVARVQEALAASF